MINNRAWAELTETFLTSEPFNHIIIDNFFTDDVAEKIVQEFLPYDSPQWRGQWDNAVENKRLHNVWDLFPETIYNVFTYLNSPEWVSTLETIVGRKNVFTDIGLHGGGLHSHKSGGHLNVHLDYIIHPKLKLKRNYNLIIYMTPNWDSEWGGGLQLWSHDSEKNAPKELIKTVDNRFNRAVIFDTTQNSWHGLPEKLDCPEGITRNSLAIYYLTQPEGNTEQRMKALFSPYKDQKDDPAVLELIRKRADVNEVNKMYR
jgi:Rps23 Pro-64 3,4-dihydroxylase Tpa1-like proline 4-hydroxylase